ncbi:MAG TPA: LacI family DNA-binding transcriptional regulator [Cyclobacteriaceae bacterium]|nr:LacI family DNA-binding transcriptional regulator [Cyclobacteriaceae bacterium]
MKTPQITIRDLAHRLNISVSTVSRALRNAPDINEETKQAVLDMARQLKYEPNRVAQSLRSNKTNTLGVIVPEIELHFFSASISGIQEYATQQGYTIMITQSLETYAMEKNNLQMLVANRVDGLIISLSSQTRNVEHLRDLLERDIPVIMFDRVSDEINVSKVIVDDHDGAYKLVSHLIETGCKRIAFLGGPENLYISQQRKKGYLDALRKHGYPIVDEIIVHARDIQYNSIHGAQKLLDLNDRPDAIFCFIDPIAIPTMQLAKEKGISIPDELSIAGFTNEPVSQYIEPSLTTVAQPAFELGKEAARLFFEQMRDKENFEPVTKVVPTELIIRNSTRKTRN